MGNPRFEKTTPRGVFDCCRFCKPPKRHPTCHGNCKEYSDAKALHEEMKKQKQREKELQDYIRNN